MEGTNCDSEAYRAFRQSKFIPEFVHINELDRGKKRIGDYSAVFIPGGFSGGDYIRAGALFSARLRKHMPSIIRFVDSGRPVIGVCNGFQILADLGLLPDISGKQEREVALSVNKSGKFECRDTYLRVESDHKLIGSRYKKGDVALATVAHSEGRLIFRNEETNAEAEKRNLVLFRYSNQTGETAGYPWNPNGSAGDIAGLSNESGNVIGMMPHPERKLFVSRDHSVGKVFGQDFFSAIHDYAIKQ